MEENSFGFVFINCKLTGDAPEGKVYLGRPWRIHAKTVFINTEIGAHINPEGWHNWNKPEAEKTATYAEYGSYGRGANDSQRVSWSRILTEEEASIYTVENVLKGSDNWKPFTL